MIVVECTNAEGGTYARGIPVTSINTVTESDDGMTWIKFWDGSKAVSVKTAGSVEQVAQAVANTRK